MTEIIQKSNQQWIKEERRKWHSYHHGGLHMTEQFKLFKDAQESKIFKTNVTNINIKCLNNFLRRYSVEITYTSLELSENFIMHTSKQVFPSAKITLQITHSDWWHWSNLVTHTACLEMKHWTIVNWVEWLWNPLESFVICFCGPESAQPSKEFLSFWLYWPIKTLH